VAPVVLELEDAAALDGSARAAIVQLCTAAYDEDFSRLFDQFPGTVHVLAKDDHGTLVGHAMWVARRLEADGHHMRTAYVEAVATAPAFQRRGIGTAIMVRLVQAVMADAQWDLAALSPAVPEFYERRGWEPWKGPLAIRRNGLLDPSPPDELVMIRRLARTPSSLVTTALLTAEWRPGELW
jgi:aminoglycoside 2'-N-acetyltransferase I